MSTSPKRTAQLALGGISVLVLAVIALAVIVIVQPGADAPDRSSTATTPSTKQTSSAPSASSPTATPTPSPTESSPFGFTPETPAEKAAVEAARVMTTWDPAKDVDPTASEARAKRLMTSERAAEVVVSGRGTADPEWMRAYRRNLVSEPTALIVPGGEQDTITVNVIWDWVSEDGTRAAGKGARTFSFTMTDADAPKVADYTWSGSF